MMAVMPLAIPRVAEPEALVAEERVPQEEIAVMQPGREMAEMDRHIR
jgi:hypothetical protein